MFCSILSRPLGASLVLLVGLGFLPVASHAQTTEPTSTERVQIDVITTGLNYPWALTFLPDGRMLITERTGQLRLVTQDGVLLDRRVPGLPDIYVSGQGGLQDIALAPDFTTSQRVFFSYSCGTDSANHLCLASARFVDDSLSEVQEIFRTQPAKAGSAHYGGRMAFLPDQTLLLTTGDGFDYREQAQNRTNTLGKIVRVEQDGSIPNDNPFLDQPEAAPELYSLGHRNPQGIVYDPITQQVISHEHGPRGGDEVNRIQAGNNYGWPIVTTGLDYTGALVTPFQERPGLQAPLWSWTPSIAPSGLAVYTGDLFPQWRGHLFVTALAGKALHRLQWTGNQILTEERLLVNLDERLRDVRVGPDSAIYVLTDSADGRLLRLTPN